MESKHNKKRAGRIKRIQQAWQLRLAGHNYEFISKQLGVSKGQISHDLADAYAEWHKQMQAEAIHFAEMDLARLDRMLAALEPQVQAGDVKSITAAIRILERRAKLIGYDKATKVEVAASPDMNPDALVAAIQAKLESNGSAAA